MKDNKGVRRKKLSHDGRAVAKNMGLSNFSMALNLTDMEQYKLGPMLGQGAYAMVREGLHLRTNYKVAIKVYDKYKLLTNNQIQKCVEREIQTLSALMKAFYEKGSQYVNCYPIMKLYDAVDKARHVYLIVENCRGK